MAIKATESWAPGDELVVITPSDANDIYVANPTADSKGIKIHNVGTAGLVYVDGARSGTNVPIYLRQGDWSPCLVKRVYATNLGAGVLITGGW